MRIWKKIVTTLDLFIYLLTAEPHTPQFQSFCSDEKIIV